MVKENFYIFKYMDQLKMYVIVHTVQYISLCTVNESVWYKYKTEDKENTSED